MRRPVFLLAVSVLALAIAGCGGGRDGGAARGPIARYDKALHDSLPADVLKSGELRVVTDASYAPASSFARDGHTIVGFEPDLGAALGRVLGVRVRFVNTDFGTVLARVRRHRADLVMSAMTDTPERERSADFVNYFSAGTSIVVQRGNPWAITDLDSLCGHPVAVEADTIQVDLLARAQHNCHGSRIRVSTYPTNADALLQLRTGRAGAVLNDYPPAAYLATDAATRTQYQLASTAQYEPGPYGIAVAKDRPDLRDAVRAALGELMRSGVYRAILARWNVSAGAVPDATLNAGA